MSTLLLGQQIKDTTTVNTMSLGSDINVNFPTTIQVKDITDKNNQTFWEKNMPWIVAFIIGMLSVIVNLWATHKLRESNERNLQRQIESSERIIESQLKTAKESKLLEFKATIASKNRQDWINELREALSEYLSVLTLMKPIHSTTPEMMEERNINLQRLSLAKSKLDLLMNKDKPEQKILIEKIDNMLGVVTKHPKENYFKAINKSRNEIILAARHLFGIHWKKIKELE